MNEFAAQHPILAVALPKIVVLLFVLLTSLAYLTWFERKVVASPSRKCLHPHCSAPISRSTRCASGFTRSATFMTATVIR